MAIIAASDIDKYIPQKAPIVMVGELISHSGETTESQFKIAADNIFCENGVLTEPGLIENIAQTAALRMGYMASQKTTDAEPPVGFIGAISKLKIHSLPAVGQSLHTRIEIKNDIFGITLIQGTSYVDGHIQAECEMKIVITGQA